jgi:hypothetical protein
MTKIAGSGSISQKHGFADTDPDPEPDPHQNVTDPQHRFLGTRRMTYTYNRTVGFPGKII